MHQSLSIEPIRRTRTKFCRLFRDDRRQRLSKERGVSTLNVLAVLAVLAILAGAAPTMAPTMMGARDGRGRPGGAAFAHFTFAS